MMSILRRRWVFRAALVLSAVLAGCSSTAPPVEPYRWPDNYQFNFRWSGTQGLDLASEQLTVVRAAVESAFLVDLVGWLPGATPRPYPGYRGSTGGSPLGFSFTNFLSAEDSLGGTFYGYVINVDAVAPLQSPGDLNVRNSGWRVGACVWLNGLAFDTGGGLLYSVERAALVPRHISIYLTPPPAGRPTRLVAGSGPARFPSADVFGEWGVDMLNSRPGGPVSDTDRDCGARPDNPVPAELRALPERGVKHTYTRPLPTLDAYPGWPEGAK
ncbi:hypothetical protein ABZ319_33190 [Nocardia sp. NPDC005978]|uniref:hypothetical protein n=1 Tax=Nocardia sp. NPDC005978 TaxID=3156725 RepID=UPI0033A65B06